MPIIVRAKQELGSARSSGSPLNKELAKQKPKPARAGVLSPLQLQD